MGIFEVMKKILSLAAVVTAILVLTGFSDKGKSSWGDYVVACGDKDLYIIDTQSSTQDSLAVVWHWNVDEAKGQIPDEDVHRARVLDDCKPVDGGKRLLLTSSGGEPCFWISRQERSFSMPTLPCPTPRTCFQETGSR